MQVKRILSGFPDLHKVEALAKEAFPPEEYLAPSKLIQMSDYGEVDFWGLYDRDEFVGFMVISIHNNISYLFFLAIDQNVRSKGYGSQALQMLVGLYPGRQQVVDFEMIDESAPNYIQRVIRKAFYIRNGYKETGKFISYLGVDYEILCDDNHFDFESFKEMMAGFHIEGFNPRYFDS